MEEQLYALLNCRLFSELPEETIRKTILPAGMLRSFSKKEIIISVQQKVDWFGVLIQGCVQISQLFSDGGSSLMTTLQPPHLLGADLICTKTRLSPYYAIASAPAQIVFFR